MSIVRLRCWAGKMKDFHFQPCRQRNGLPFPFVKPVRYDANGNSEMILSDAERNDPNSKYFIPEDLDIYVKDGTEFNLDDPYQKNVWECIKTSDLIVPTRDAKDENGDFLIDGNKKHYGIAELWVDIPGEESEKKVNKRKKIVQAQQFIFNDSVNGMITKCALLGKEGMNNAPVSDVTDFLCQRADKNPDEIINLYTDGDTKLRLLVLDAKKAHIIIRKDGLFMYGESILGATDDSIVMYLKNPTNKAIFDALKVETYPEYVTAVKEKKTTKKEE